MRGILNHVRENKLNEEVSDDADNLVKANFTIVKREFVKAVEYGNVMKLIFPK